MMTDYIYEQKLSNIFADLDYAREEQVVPPVVAIAFEELMQQAIATMFYQTAAFSKIAEERRQYELAAANKRSTPANPFIGNKKLEAIDEQINKQLTTLDRIVIGMNKEGITKEIRLFDENDTRTNASRYKTAMRLAFAYKETIQESLRDPYRAYTLVPERAIDRVANNVKEDTQKSTVEYATARSHGAFERRSLLYGYDHGETRNLNPISNELRERVRETPADERVISDSRAKEMNTVEKYFKEDGRFQNLQAMINDIRKYAMDNNEPGKDSQKKSHDIGKDNR